MSRWTRSREVVWHPAVDSPPDDQGLLFLVRTKSGLFQEGRYVRGTWLDVNNNLLAVTHWAVIELPQNL